MSTRTFAGDVLAHARRTPGRVALTGPGTTLTYGELAHRARAAAHALTAAGAGPEDVVAVAVTSAADAATALTAVTLSGAAFLTLDTALPAERLAAMTGSAGARLTLTTTALAGRLTLPVPGPTVLLDAPGPVPDTDPPGPPGARSLAYVSHTSGSTGTPNAVLIEHGGLDSYLRSTVRDFGLGAATVAVPVAPLGYDASIRDLLAPLVAGGRLVDLPRSAQLRPAEFTAALRASRATALLSVTPTFLTFLAAHLTGGGGPLGPGLVASSGESLRPFLAAGGRRLLTGRLVNQYGPTECTMTSTRYEVPAEPDLTADRIGTPIDGVTLYVLGPGGQPVPDGETGEIHLGGAGVARGYRGRAALTADRFRPDPFSPLPGARMYATGDLARRLPGGGLELLGRSDRQIKIRGYRVDPAEIEGALLTQPGLTGAVVTADTDERGRRYLTAHITGDLGGVTDAVLRQALARTLPVHMMPRRFARLDRIPTTVSGKTDRAVLGPAGGAR